MSAKCIHGRGNCVDVQGQQRPCTGTLVHTHVGRLFHAHAQHDSCPARSRPNGEKRGSPLRGQRIPQQHTLVGIVTPIPIPTPTPAPATSPTPTPVHSAQHADRRPRGAKTRRCVWRRLHGAPCRGGTWLRQGRCAGGGQGMWGGSGSERGGGSASSGQPLAIVCCGSVYCIYAFGVLGRRRCVSGGSPVARQGSVWLFYKGACISFCR